ncbi:thioredoxin-domain-containing protein [Thelephora terrestris]|uniref:Thioredoxin-domain-containing protein n=1 Tax=Thelephora terrestris TaxID=56493 RepID=A0A9P6L4P3_9AGAM|nr:thioredoxin-domain-containing protein [Thelephora terrestris]
MRLLTLPPILFSLLLVLVLLVDSAPAQVDSEERPPNGVDLDPDNFLEVTSVGTWFVEFFSPYCGHCRQFEPTWKELVTEVYKMPNSPLSMGRMNCAVHGDKCGDLGVNGWPQLNVYKNGEFVDTFRKARELNLLKEYLEKHIDADTDTETHEPPPPTQKAPTRVPNPDGKVLKLDGRSFPNEIKNGGGFVKFFAPWCGHCKKLAPTWAQLAEQMKNQLTIAEVNCEEHGALCRAEDVQGYPMLYYYDDDGVKTEYTGGRKLEQLQGFVEKVLKPSIQEIGLGEFHTELRTNEVLYLLLYSPTDTRSTELVGKASGVLLGSPPVYMSSSSGLASQLNVETSSLPMLLVFKDGDAERPAAQWQLKASYNAEDIKFWLLRNRLPSALKLDSDTFQPVMNPKHISAPLVVIAVVSERNRQNVISAIKPIGKQWREGEKYGKRDVVFAWMDGERWSSWLKSMYGIVDLGKAETPSVVIADHANLVYYDVEPQGSKIQLTHQSIMSTLESIAKGKAKAKHSENFFERTVRSINNGLVVLEYYVVNHVKTILFIVFLLLIAFVQFVRKALSDPAEYPDVHGGTVRYEKHGNGYLRKSNRVD